MSLGSVASYKYSFAIVSYRIRTYEKFFRIGWISISFMFRWTIFGIVVILPRLVSSTLLTFGDLTLMPLSPRRRLKYRFLIESRAAKVLLFFFASMSSTIRFASSRSRLEALRSWSSGVPAYFFSVDWAMSVTSDEQEREQGDHEHDEAVPQSVRDLPGVQDSREDAVPEAVHDRRDEERDPDLVDDPRKVLGQRALDGAARRGQRAARLEHLRQERHVQDPDRHEEHHEGNVNHRDVRRHRDPALVLGQLVLLRVMADHRQDVGDVASCIGGLDDDGDDPPDHRGLHAVRKEAQRLRRGDAPRDLGCHLLDFRRELPVAASRRDDDGLGQGHAETPGLRDIAEEVREPAFDLLDLPLKLRHVESVRPDEAEGRHHEPIQEALKVSLSSSEREVHRVDQVQEADEPEEHEQGRPDANDALAAVPLLGPLESGFLELDVRHLSPPVPCSK